MIRSQSFKRVFIGAVYVFFFGLFHLGSAHAQATIQVSGTASTVTKTGHTELLGSVTFTVASGTSVAGTLEFFLPNVAFTNSLGTGITLSGTGGFAGASIAAVIPESGVVIINVPAGASVGASITLSGVRASLVSTTVNSLDASISSTGNSVVAGQNTVRIVQSVLDGLIVENSGGNVITVVDGFVVTGPGTFIVSEGWQRAFSSAVGVAGQTTKIQLIFRVNGLPDNVSLTFPSPLTSGNGATLTTVSGVAEVLTNQSVTNRVVYEFTDSASSPLAIDGFSVSPTLSFNGTPGTGTATIQVGLGPIGAAVPGMELPSTAIPRFAEQFLPPAPNVEPTVITKVLPVLGTLDEQHLTISNTSSGGAVVSLRARADDGSLASALGLSEVTLNLSARQTTTASIKEVFGASASPANVSAVEVRSQNNSLIINSIGTIGGRRFAIGRLPEMILTYLPFDRQSSSDIPELTIHNAGNLNAAVTVTLRNSSGASLATATRNVNSLGTNRESFSSLFPSVSLPTEGYVAIRGSAIVGVALLNTPQTRPEEIPSLPSVNDSPIIGPFFAFGGGYNTTLSLMNSSDIRSVRATIRASNPDGSPLSSPFVATIGPNERQSFDFRSIFGTSSVSATVVGYFSVALEPTVVTSPFQSPPAVFGALRISTDTLSTVVPLSEDSNSQLFVTPGAETAATYTGFAILNPNSTPTLVTVEMFSSNGGVIGSTTFTLNGNSAEIKLARELVPQSFSNDNVLVRISSDSGNLKITSIRGTLDFSELLYLGGQTP